MAKSSEFQLRVTPAEKVAWRRAASAQGLSVSAWARSLLNAQASGLNLRVSETGEVSEVPATGPSSGLASFLEERLG